MYIVCFLWWFVKMQSLICKQESFCLQCITRLVITSKSKKNVLSIVGTKKPCLYWDLSTRLSLIERKLCASAKIWKSLSKSAKKKKYLGQELVRSADLKAHQSNFFKDFNQIKTHENQWGFWSFYIWSIFRSYIKSKFSLILRLCAQAAD